MHNLSLRGLALVAAAALLSVGARPAQAQIYTVSDSPFTVTASSGDRSASAKFTVTGNNLTIELTNTGQPADDPAEILTALFFSTDATFDTVSAILGDGSKVIANGTDVGVTQPTGGNVGGEWRYQEGGWSPVTTAPGGANRGISSAGLGLFGSSPNFNGPDLDVPSTNGTQQLDGHSFGIVHGVTINPQNAHDPMRDQFISNQVLFTLTNTSGGWTGVQFSNFSFQYGTTLGGNTGYTLNVVPEGSSLLMLTGGLMPLLGGLGLIRRRKRD